MMVFPKHVLLANKFDDTYYFDPKYPFGGNETEWFNRFIKIGGQPIVVPRTFIYHYKIARWKKNQQLNDTCIYTINTGGYEGNIINLDNRIGLDCLYFTDNWEVIYNCIEQNIIPFYVNTKDKESKLIQRTIKAAPHLYLPYNYDISTYIDGNMVPLIDRKIGFCGNELNSSNTDMIHFCHKNGHTVEQECFIIEKFKLETKENIQKIYSIFNKDKFNANECNCSETGILIRKHKNIEKFSEHWVELIKHCRRDQASFNYLVWKHKLSAIMLPSNDRPIKIKKHINPHNRLI
jgi:hypothetical protein